LRREFWDEMEDYFAMQKVKLRKKQRSARGGGAAGGAAGLAGAAGAARGGGSGLAGAVAAARGGGSGLAGAVAAARGGGSADSAGAARARGAASAGGKAPAGVGAASAGGGAGLARADSTAAARGGGNALAGGNACEGLGDGRALGAMYCRRYYQKHREQIRQSQREYLAANLERCREAGARLRAARLARGWTQAQLGRALGVSKAAVCHWERGRVPFDVQRLARLPRLMADVCPGAPGTAEAQNLQKGRADDEQGA
jgi:DNA-binding XRE family transcriptional regulator